MARRELRGLRVVVTGASGGIGEALALELADRGANVLVTARREEPLKRLTERLQSNGVRAAYVVGDVTDEAHRCVIIEQARSQFDGLDVLINNAGLGAFGRFDDADPARLRKLMEVDFFAAVELTRSAIPLLRTGRTPAIVNIASILAYRSIPFAAEYCAAKFAIRGFSESLRAELSRDGIDVVLVNPGTTDTAFFENVVEMKTKLPWRSDKASQGASPASVARAAVDGLARGRNEIFPGLGPKFLMLANRIAPRIIDWWMRRYSR